jgi:hypothetical protein
MGAMLLSLVAAALWSGSDAMRASIGRVLVRWVAVILIVGGGLGIASTLLAPGSPPSERTSEMVGMSLFYCVPLLVVVGLGVVVGMAAAKSEQPTRTYEDPGGTRP